MKRLLLILLLCPLATSAADWSYDGQMTAVSTSTGEAAATETSMSGSDSSMAVGSASPAPIGAPANNMTMTSVRQSMGEPVNEWAPVGDPPITRWQYPDYVVYFEHELVITSVGGHW